MEVGLGLGSMDGKIRHAEEVEREEEEEVVLVVLDVVYRKITKMKHVASMKDQTHSDSLKKLKGRFSFLINMEKVMHICAKR